MGSLTELQAAKSMEQFISRQQDLDHSLKPIDHHSLETSNLDQRSLNAVIEKRVAAIASTR